MARSSVKLIRCNGRVLEVRDVGPVIFRLLAGNVPIKQLTGLFVDREARAICRRLLDTGLYAGGKVVEENRDED